MLFDGFADGLALVGVPAEDDGDRAAAALEADEVDPAIVSDGIGAGEGLSKLNCGKAPPL